MFNGTQENLSDVPEDGEYRKETRRELFTDGSNLKMFSSSRC